jgi:hypothetical protein
MEGYVTKRGHLFKNWKVRWFHLNNGEIAYFKGNLLFIDAHYLLLVLYLLTSPELYLTSIAAENICCNNTP